MLHPWCWQPDVASRRKNAVSLDDTPNVSPKVSAVEFKFDVEIYNEIARSAALADLRTVASEFLLKEECIPSLQVMEEKVKSIVTGQIEDHFYDSERGVVAGKYTWSAEMKVGRLKALKCNASYLAVYSDLANRDSEHVAIFYDKLSRFASYPYFRAHFSAQVAAANLLIPPLPSLRDRVD